MLWLQWMAPNSNVAFSILCCLWQAARNNVLLAVPAFLYAINNYLKFTMQVRFLETDFLFVSFIWFSLLFICNHVYANTLHRKAMALMSLLVYLLVLKCILLLKLPGFLAIDRRFWVYLEPTNLIATLFFAVIFQSCNCEDAKQFEGSY